MQMGVRTPVQPFSRCLDLPIEQAARIPSRFARVGAHIRIKDDDGWVVERVDGTSSEECLKEHERDYKNQRSVSDI